MAKLTDRLEYGRLLKYLTAMRELGHDPDGLIMPADMYRNITEGMDPRDRAAFFEPVGKIPTSNASWNVKLDAIKRFDPEWVESSELYKQLTEEQLQRRVQQGKAALVNLREQVQQGTTYPDYVDEAWQLYAREEDPYKKNQYRQNIYQQLSKVRQLHDNYKVPLPAQYARMDHAHLMPFKQMLRLSPNFYKKLMQSTNLDKAMEEVHDFFNDHVNRTYGGGKPEALQSMNQLRSEHARLNQVAIQVQNSKEIIKNLPEGYDGKIDYDTGNIEYIETPDGNKVSVDAVQDIVEQARLKEQQRYTASYPYTEDVKKAIGNGWRLLEDYADQVYTGAGLGHCYGDYCKYKTDEHGRRYNAKILGKDLLLLNKDNVTAEIGIEKDDNDYIVRAEVGQVQSPDNVPVEDNDPMRRELQKIADKLKGKYICDLNAKNIERILSDKLLKYMPRTNYNIANAIRQRKY